MTNTRQQNTTSFSMHEGSGLSYLKTLMAEWSIIQSLGLRMARRNIQSAYRDSWIGFAWMFIQPFTSAILWILLRENKIISVNVPGMNYPVFVISGTLCWQAFCDGLMISQRAIHDNRSMLTKINVPPEGLLLAGLAETFIRLISSALISLIVIALHTQEIPGINGIGWLLGPSMGLCLGFSAGWLLAPPLLLLPDLLRMLLLLLPFMMYLTPVVYDVPESGLLQIVMTMNPLHPIISGTRDILIHETWHIRKLVMVPIICLMTAIVFGGYTLRRSLPHIIQQMGS